MKPISLVSPAAGSTLSLLLAAPATENGTPAGGGDGAKGRASPPWQPSSDAPAGAARRHRFRKQIVEPVFGQIKHAQGLPTVPLRGFEKVRAEWALICTAHNLLKLAKATG